MSSGEATDYAAVADYLFSLKARGVKFGIDRMRLLAAALGHPERAAPIIHIAGTNGKGSVGAMLDARHPACRCVAHWALYLAPSREAGRTRAGGPPAADRGGNHRLHARTPPHRRADRRRGRR